MNKNTIKIFSAILSTLFLIVPLFVFAQIKNPLGDVTITSFVSSLLDYIVKIGGIGAVFAFIWSGFLFVQAQGNPAGLKTANQVFINTCIGVAVLLGAKLIASIIIGTIRSIS